MPVGFHHSVMDVPDNVEDADVILHARENCDVQAHMVIFRTNGSFARCFLDAWIEEGLTGFMSNFDNGALMRLVLHVLAPDLVAKCDKRRSDYNEYTRCFAQIAFKLGRVQSSCICAHACGGVNAHHVRRPTWQQVSEACTRRIGQA